jgi:hypothetical protein
MTLNPRPRGNSGAKEMNMNTWTISAKNSESDFEQHRFWVSGPHGSLEEAERAREEVESLGYQSVEIVEGDE